MNRYTSAAIEVTKQQRDNLMEAMHVMWPSVPEQNVSSRLGRWRDTTALGFYSERSDTPPTCGTVACFGGWCAWWPSFMAQGIHADGTGAPSTKKRGYYADPGAAARKLFGDGNLFLPRDMHPADKQVPSSASDHELVKERLYWLLHASKVKP
jgi:hypothetical protein